ncbi:MAG TPA: alpha/beta hydrolase domain-containing protein [Candidatus Binatus sp.]|nr:alpha/beta hydrolase domain-containing protein [Candidatus Binatus sp.]
MGIVRHRSAVLLHAAILAVLGAGVASAEVAAPSIEGPITGGRGTPFVASTSFDLAQVGYIQEEFFISGTAAAYTSAGALTSDGMWTVTPAATAAYKTRLLVYRPASRTKFNGTVFVEWLNVSGGLDAAPDWTGAHTEMIRQGIAWVGVSAQRIGVEGGTPIIPGLPLLPLKTVDAARYGSLVHPGDSFSYDIFSQAGQAIRHPAGASPLGNLELKKLIGAGESQSAFRLVTYIDAVHPLARVYDGFLVHSRGTSGAALSEPPQSTIRAPRPTLIRSDLRVPVLTFETETDLFSLLQYYSDRQPDTDRFRLWEVPGTAHADTYSLVVGATDLGKSPAAAELLVTSKPIPGIIECGAPINSGPQHFVLDAAIDALDRWVRRGTLPRPAPRLEVTAGAAHSIVRDAHGNALGGIRTPQVDVPIATLSGEGQTGSLLCLLFGTTVPFDAATLASLYPDHRSYVSAYSRATRRAMRAGFILKHDAKLMRAAAAASAIGR